jgi:DNA-binding transcriptional LysR family regulator
VVRLTAPPAVAEELIAPALPRLRERYPAIVLELDGSVSHADLARREADIAVPLVRPTSGDLTHVKLAEDPSVVAASASLAASLGALRALEDAPWIAWDASLGHLPDARWVAKHVPQDAVVLRSNSAGALLGAAQRGVGVFLLSRALARARELSPVRLTKPLRASLSSTPTTSLWLVGHQALRRVPRIAAVWTFVIEEARSSGLMPLRALR